LAFFLGPPRAKTSNPGNAERWLITQCALIAIRSASHKMNTSFSHAKPRPAVVASAAEAAVVTEMKKRGTQSNWPAHLAWAWLFVCLIGPAHSAPVSPFRVYASMDGGDGLPAVRFNFKVPPEHIIYFDRLHFNSGSGEAFTPDEIPTPVVFRDKVSGHEKKGYTEDFSAVVKLNVTLPQDVIVKFQGCSNSACYFPEKWRFSVKSSTEVMLRPDASAPPPTEAPDSVVSSAINDWRSELENFSLVGRKTGYLNRKEFLTFLDASQSMHASVDDPLEKFKSLSVAGTSFFILLGGIGLNLTPCVLPLIPINLAIIGAGTRARSRKGGFFLGLSYGTGMALVYGALGLIVVLTGAKFGALNSSLWFNIAIAAIFGVLSLGMFDVIDIDFSRWQSGSGNTTIMVKRNGYKQTIFAFVLGIIAALLAGACVAPVVISVLLLSANLYAKGLLAGLLLPFLLGIGMALPWPFAGAGLQCLPKPGKWMKWIKYGFGILILGFAFYYGQLAFKLYDTRATTMALTMAPSGSLAKVGGTAGETLQEKLHQAQLKHLPVFIDFAASWCKNCTAMDETVFNSAAVTQRLSDFVVIQFQAERPNESPAKEVLDRFGVVGLPTYLVLAPNK
jgi:thiol:disulfide interchange protein